MPRRARRRFCHHPAVRDLSDLPLPRLCLATLPTPVERAPGLARALGAGDLWVKRDDRSGTLYGGNKVRKLEWLLAAAQARGRTRLATVGGIGSNHVLATALYARPLGLSLDAAVFLHPKSASSERSVRAALAAGVRYHVARSPASLPAAMMAARRGRPAAHWIPAGGSSPLGSLGYVEAALELAAQIDDGECPRPDVIVLPLGSGGTVAGLLVGLALAGLEVTVLAVAVVHRFITNESGTRRLAARTAALLCGHGVDVPPGRRPLEVVHDAFGRGYAYPTAEGTDAVRAAADAGLALETTYTGKALAAVAARKERFSRATVLFWNTYSSVDLAPLAAQPPASPVPPRLARWLETELAP